MKSLILSRHPPPSSSEENEKYVDTAFIWLTAIVVDEGDNGGGDQTGENIQEGQTQHCRIKNVPGREDSILLIWQFRNVWQQILTDIIKLPHLNIWMGLNLWVLVCTTRASYTVLRKKLKSDTGQNCNVIETYFDEVTPTKRTMLLRRTERTPLRTKTKRRTACQGRIWVTNKKVSVTNKKVSPAKLRLFSTVAFEQAVCCSDSSLVILAIFLLSISSILHQDSPSVRVYVVPHQCLPCPSLSPVHLILHWHFLLQSYGVFLFPPFPSLYPLLLPACRAPSYSQGWCTIYPQATAPHPPPQKPKLSPQLSSWSRWWINVFKDKQRMSS